MNINFKSDYYNSIYSAIVVNDDSSQDPLNRGRVQVYIPSLQYQYGSVYKTYMENTNKKEDGNFNKFPWATTLVSNLKVGNIVYGNFIDNDFNKYLVLGLDVNNPANQGSGSGDVGSTGLLSGDIVNLAMPIIMHNEVGLPTNAWPDNIPTQNFTKIEDVSDKPRGIGLVQWTASRAYDLLYDIASSDNNWVNCFPDKSLSLYNDLQTSINKGSASQERNNNAMTGPIAAGGAVYTAVQSMLGLSVSFQIQKEKASDETATVINTLQNSSYNITNPALLIYMSDVVNQYSTPGGFTSALASTVSKLKQINDNGKSMMEQLYEFNSWLKSTFAQPYSSRRDTTVAYIEELEKQGKLFSGTLVDLGDLQDTKWIPEAGEYLWPCTKSYQINCYFGDTSMQRKFAQENKDKFYWNGLIHNSPHGGVDFAPAKCGVDGDPIIAVGSGKVVEIYTNPSSGYGYGIKLQMSKNTDHYFVYGHFCKPVSLRVGDKVTAGQVIGYMGTTGNSTGTHLHLEIRPNNVYSKSNPKNNPLLYLGKRANA